jgi:hypothetical protein
MSKLELVTKRKIGMCVMVLLLASDESGLALARKSRHNPTMHKMPLLAISQRAG